MTIPVPVEAAAITFALVFSVYCGAVATKGIADAVMGEFKERKGR